MKKDKLPKRSTSFLTKNQDGTFTTEDLMKLGMSSDEANKLLEKLCAQGIVKLMPLHP